MIKLIIQLKIIYTNINLLKEKFVSNFNSNRY